METRANHVLIGVFTLLVVVSLFGFVWWFGGTRDVSSRSVYRIVFEGSVSGLSRGSSVLFNGIKVGEVSTLQFDVSDPNIVIALVAIDPTTPVREDTKARLEFQGLTGVSAVMLTGGSKDKADLKGDPKSPPTIVAERSAVQDLLESARNILARADGVMTAVERVVSDNREPVARTVRNIERFSDALAKNSDAVGSFLASTGDAAKAITRLSGELEGLSVEARRIVQAVSPEKIQRIIDDANKFSDALARQGGKFDQLFDDAGLLASNLRGASERLTGTLNNIDKLVVAVDPAKVRQAVDDTTKFTDALGRNAGNVDQIVKEARELAERLNVASTRIDGILSKADSFLGDANSGGLISEVREAAKSIRTLADNLDKRTATLSSDISAFTGPGLRDLQGLISSGRQTISSVDRIVRDFERNPQRFIFGGGGIRDYRR